MEALATRRYLAARATLIALLVRARRPARGQGLVEYALILGFMAILVIVALQFLQPAVTNTFVHVGNCLNAVQTPLPTPTGGGATSPCH